MECIPCNCNQNGVDPEKTQCDPETGKCFCLEGKQMLQFCFYCPICVLINSVYVFQSEDNKTMCDFYCMLTFSFILACPLFLKNCILYSASMHDYFPKIPT